MKTAADALVVSVTFVPSTPDGAQNILLPSSSSADFGRIGAPASHHLQWDYFTKWFLIPAELRFCSLYDLFSAASPLVLEAAVEICRGLRLPSNSFPPADAFLAGKRQVNVPFSVYDVRHARNNFSYPRSATPDFLAQFMSKQKVHELAVLIDILTPRMRLHCVDHASDGGGGGSPAVLRENFAYCIASSSAGGRMIPDWSLPSMATAHALQGPLPVRKMLDVHRSSTDDVAAEEADQDKDRRFSSPADSDRRGRPAGSGDQPRHYRYITAMDAYDSSLASRLEHYDERHAAEFLHQQPLHRPTSPFGQSGFPSYFRVRDGEEFQPVAVVSEPDSDSMTSEGSEDSLSVRSAGQLASAAVDIQGKQPVTTKRPALRKPRNAPQPKKPRKAVAGPKRRYQYSQSTGGKQSAAKVTVLSSKTEAANSTQLAASAPFHSNHVLRERLRLLLDQRVGPGMCSLHGEDLVVSCACAGPKLRLVEDAGRSSRGRGGVHRIRGKGLCIHRTLALARTMISDHLADPQHQAYVRSLFAEDEARPSTDGDGSDPGHAEGAAVDSPCTADVVARETAAAQEEEEEPAPLKAKVPVEEGPLPGLSPTAPLQQVAMPVDGAGSAHSPTPSSSPSEEGAIRRLEEDCIPRREEHSLAPEQMTLLNETLGEGNYMIRPPLIFCGCGQAMHCDGLNDALANHASSSMHDTFVKGVNRRILDCGEREEHVRRSVHHVLLQIAAGYSHSVGPC